MGRFIPSMSKRHEYSMTIVLVEWQNSTQTDSPRVQFWTLDCPVGSQPQPQALPIPEAVPDRINELGPRQSEKWTDGGRSKVHLPPLVAYDTASSSIMMHSLIAGDDVDVDFSRWGPGIRLTEVQAMERLFNGAPAGLGDAKHLSPLGCIRSNIWRGSVDGPSSSSSGYLMAIAMGDGNGVVEVKYRSKKLERDSFASRLISKAYKFHEQTVRTAWTLEASETGCWPPSSSSIPLHVFSVGSRMSYLVLATLCQNRAKTANILSLRMINDTMAFSESSSMVEANEDRGLRWQVQNFELPLGVSNVAPIVLGVDRKPHLFVFYFDQGALHYARAKYAGSARFTDFCDKLSCATNAAEEMKPSAHASSTVTRSRWSVVPYQYRSSRPQEPDPALSAEPEGKQLPVETLPLAAEGCQPYVVVANDFVWIFYEGADKDAKYVRHKVLRDVDTFGEGWEAASWETGSQGAGGSRHFVPVVVPGDFMAMR
ncbi:hypothetical protein B0J13DRAFT_527124 [Dactylonectria estremocensis]|uniref:Uncharacterized protein n=1 Tax=Dactylonectria estremocensis TaxID=1079267 RepID=A0A9P9EM79_9HYPO|nr:hypothetical protein B0J13DRAFT_527124 [Dactylonectria estremocensis]